jgi:N utilization substance protein A
MHFEMMEALEVVARERGIPVETILDALANALVSAYKRSPGAAEEARVTIDPDSGEMLVYAQELDEDGNVVREWEDTPDDFGRIAAQTAKQVIEQRLRDAKREQVYEQYVGRQGDLVTGLVQQVDHRYTIVDLGDAEAIMPASERIPYERLERGARIKAYIVEVRDEGRGAPIVVSRSHPEFIRALFELEVPELTEGIVEIKAIAREPGHRTKLAVISNDPAVDPVGACVGARGARVRQVVNELRGEKVDLIQYRDDPRQFITEALSPVRGVREVKVDDEEKEAIVIVPDNQLSLAIGKEGQNARLAARLTGYRIDIRSESNPEGRKEEEPGEQGPQAALAGEPEAAATGEAAAAEETATEEAVTEEAATGEAAAAEDTAGDAVTEEAAEAVTEGDTAEDAATGEAAEAVTEGDTAEDAVTGEAAEAVTEQDTAEEAATEEAAAEEDATEAAATEGVEAEDVSLTEDAGAEAAVDQSEEVSG